MLKIFISVAGSLLVNCMSDGQVNLFGLVKILSIIQGYFLQYIVSFTPPDSGWSSKFPWIMQPFIFFL